MWPQKNESCYIDAERSVPCRQGRVPYYTIEAESARDIQAGVKFARSHNLRLAIRNTGHSYQGGSTAPESLQINTHLMKNKTLHRNFKPAGYNGTGKIEPLAVTLSAGVQLFDMYTFCGKHGVMAVGGSSHGVGAAGGYIQGGGHSMLAGIAGMASDNALEFNVVVADVSGLLLPTQSLVLALTPNQGPPCRCQCLPELRSLLGSPWWRRRHLGRRHFGHCAGLPRSPHRRLQLQRQRGFRFGFLLEGSGVSPHLPPQVQRSRRFHVLLLGSG